jgi:hypothetical protein
MAHILLEFTKDNDNVAELQKVFATVSTADKVVYHFFDEDNVSIGIVNHTLQSGTPTGIKGEAFRIYIPLLGQEKRLKRIEARSTEKKKKS